MRFVQSRTASALLYLTFGRFGGVGGVGYQNRNRLGDLTATTPVARHSEARGYTANRLKLVCRLTRRV
jgi:hypothetical protein